MVYFLFPAFHFPPFFSSGAKFQLSTLKESPLCSKRPGTASRMLTGLGRGKASFQQSLYYSFLFINLLPVLSQVVWPLMSTHTRPSCPSPTLPPSHCLCLSSSSPLSKKETSFPNFHISGGGGGEIGPICQTVPSLMCPWSLEPPRTLMPGPIPAKLYQCLGT